MKHFYLLAKRITTSLAFIGLGFSALGQTYNITSLSGTFTPLSGGTAPTTSILADDAISEVLNIGFGFSFGGTTYTQIKASSNGFISFNTGTSDDLTNNLESSLQRTLIAPLWDDLSGDVGTATYKTEGVSPNRVFTFEWLNWKWNYQASAAVISFQVKLYETTNVIDLIYRQEGTGVIGGSASIGIAMPTSGVYYSLSDVGNNPTISTTAETSTIATKPATGQTYRFSNNKPEPTNHATSFSATSNGGKIILDWVDATGTTLPDGYLIMASTVNSFTDPVDLTDVIVDDDLSDGTALVKINQGNQTYSGFNNLQYNSTYYFQIYPYTNSGSIINFKTTPTVPYTSVVFVPKAEPTNHVTGFTAMASYTNITLNWTDATGVVLPDGYLIKVSNTGIITDPVDLNDVIEDADLSDGSAMVKLGYGVQTFSGFTNLEFNNTYYFQIYPYANSGNFIDFKAESTVPVASVNYMPKPEPSNHITSFTSVNNGPTIKLGWVDAVGSVLPDGYVIMASTTNNFINPTDLTDVVPDADLNDGSAVVKVAQGIQTYSGFLNLIPETDYYFAVFPYSNSGSYINYKVDGSIPIATTYFDISNNCLSFDGIDDYVSFPTLNSTSCSSFTIEAWIYPTSLSSSGDNVIFSTNTTTAFGNIQLRIVNNAKIELNAFAFTVGGTSQRPYANYTFTPNKWYHIAVVKGYNIKFYVNGTLIPSPSLSSYTSTTFSSGTLGSFNNASYFSGIIDEFRVWNIERSEDQIRENLTTSLLGSPTGLIGCFNFNQGVAGDNNSGINSLLNNIGGINGTLTNFALNGSSSNWVLNSNTFTIKPTPTDFPTQFSASVVSDNIELTWVDASGATPPDGYLVYASSTNSFTNPTDKILPQSDNDLSDGSGVVKILQGTQGYTNWQNGASFGTWFFKIIPFTNDSTFIKYKTGTDAPVTVVSNHLFVEYPSSFDNYLDNYDIGDYNNDGYLDILAAGYNNQSYPYENSAFIYKNNGNNTFTKQSSIVLAKVGSEVSWVDYDNDNDLDALVTGIRGSSWTSVLYRNMGENVFEEQTNINFKGVASYCSAAWGDYDNDGDKDLLLCGATGNYTVGTMVYRNEGNNSFTEMTGIKLPNVKDGSASWGDYDNDGDLDIVITGNSSVDGFSETGISKVFKNNGTGLFIEQTDIQLAGLIFSSVSWGDYDNDGDLDILLNGYNSAQNAVTKIYRNNGNNSFEDQTAINLVGLGRGISNWADYDNDGNMDIILSGESRRNFGEGIKDFIIYHNNGDNSFTEHIDSIFTTSEATPYGDVNNDGRLDLITTTDIGWSYGKVKLFLNSTGKVNASPQAPSGLSTVQTDSSIVFSWHRTLGDETPANGLSYNIRIGTTPGANDVVSSMAMANGKRLVSGMGNTQVDTFFVLKNPKRATYYWSVQAVDNGYAASPFATEKSVTFSVRRQPSNLIASNIKGYSLKLNWTKGNADGGAILFGKKGNSGLALPVNHTVYSDSSVFGEGSQINSDGWFCIYIGTADSADVSGLELGTEYVFQIIGFDQSNTTYFTDIPKTTKLVAKTKDYTVLADFTNLYKTAQAWADYDNDGDLDFIISGVMENTDSVVTKLYQCNGSNKFTEIMNHNISPVSEGCVVWGDYDNDGYLDLLITGSGLTKVYKNNTDGTFSEISVGNFIGLEQSSVAWGDFDNDGDLDVIVCGRSKTGNVTKIYKNNKNDEFIEAPIFMPSNGFGNIYCADFNNDGFTDILLVSKSVSKLLINQGNFTFKEQPNTNLPTFTVEVTAVIGDGNNDGYLDVFFSGSETVINEWGWEAPMTAIFHNNGNNTFTKSSQIFDMEESTTAASASWTDLNNDGFIDLIFAGGFWYGKNHSYIYFNNGDNTYTKQSDMQIEALSFSSLCAGDYDNNGVIDILSSGAKIINQYYNKPGYGTIEVDTFKTQLYSFKPIAIKERLPQPIELKSEVLLTNVTLSWDRIESSGQANLGVSYNVNIGTSLNGNDILSGMSFENGLRKTPALGNCFMNNSFTIKNLVPGKYYWSVQAIDNNYVGGEFAVDSFELSAIQASNLKASLLTDKTTLKLYWSNGNGNQRVVFCKKGNGGFATPVDNTSYFADPEYGAGDQISNSGWYCVFNGRADSMVVNGLIPGDDYMFEVIEYTGSNGQQLYYQDHSGSNLGLFATTTFSVLKNQNMELGDWIQFADLNSDGFLDIVSNTDVVYMNQGDNNFDGMSHTELGIPGAYRTNDYELFSSRIHACADFNNDGFLDLYVQREYKKVESCGPEYYEGCMAWSYERYMNEIWLNNNDSTFSKTDYFISPVIDSTIARTYGIIANTVGDIDNDGDVDMLVSLYDHINVLKNKGDGTFDIAGTLFDVSFVMKLGDLNNDGYLDLFLINNKSPENRNLPDSTTVLFNDKKGNFIPNYKLCANGSNVAFADYDKDGYLDMAISYGHYNELYKKTNADLCRIPWDSGSSDLYHNDGTGKLINQNQNLFIGGAGASLVWNDYNNDGNLDLISLGMRYSVAFTELYKNNGNKTFSRDNDFPYTGVWKGDATFGDFDNDGDQDFLQFGYLNRSENSNMSIDPITTLYRDNSKLVSGGLLPNIKPNAPENVAVLPQQKGIKLSWSPVTGDETPSEAMSYNLRYRNVDSLTWLMSPMANDNGNRAVIGMGNIGLNTSFPLNPVSGKYIWQVQAIDGGYLGGNWSIVDTFEVKTVKAFFSASNVCFGNNTLFNNLSSASTGSFSCKWYFGDDSISNEINPVHHYLGIGTFMVSLVVKDTNGISDSIAMPVIVQPGPIASFMVSPVCEGTPTSFVNNSVVPSGFSISSWNWNFGDNAPNSKPTEKDPGNYTYSIPKTYIANLKIVGQNGCSDSVSHEVIVTPKPNANLFISSGSQFNFCKNSGDSAHISVELQPNCSYQWIKDNIAVGGLVLSSITVKDNGGLYKCKVSNDIGGCSATSSTGVQITVNNSPDPFSIIPPLKTTICEGDTVKLGVPVIPGVTYLWTGGLNPSTENTYNATTSGTYRLNIKNSSNCSVISSNSINVLVKPKPEKPNLINSLGSLSNICSNQSLTLSIDEPLADHTYKWYNETGPISGQTSADYLVTATGNYYARVTNPNTNCSDSSAQKQITVNAVPDKPSLEYNALNTIFCDGQSITLSTPAIADSYIWLKGTVETVGTNTLVASESGVYGLKVAKLYPNSLTCYSGISEVVTVTKNPRPSKPNLVNSLGSVSNICSNQSLTLSIDEPLADHTYKWYNETGPISGQTSTDYLVTATGNYYARVTNPNTNCSDSSAQKQITVNAVPDKPSLEYNALNTIFCDGQSITLSTPALADSYIWLRGTIETVGTNTLVASESGVYGLKVAKLYPNSLTCYSGMSEVVTVTKNQRPSKPNLVNSLGSVSNICSNQSLTLSIDEPLANHTYKWYNETGPISGQTSTDYLVTATGNYYARVTNPNTNCSDSSAQKQITVNAVPDKPSLEYNALNTIFCDGQSITLSTPAIADSYIWLRGTVETVGTNTLVASESGVYGLKVAKLYPNSLTCYSGMSEVVTVTKNQRPSKPNLVNSLGSVSNICSNQSLTLSIDEPLANHTYKWYNETGPISGQTSTDYLVTATGNYYARVTNPNTNCSDSSAQKQITVNAVPDKPSLEYNALNTIFCDGQSITLSTPAIADSYIWLRGTIETVGTNTLVASESGVYGLKVAKLYPNSLTCYSGMSEVVTVTKNPRPSKPNLVNSLGSVSNICSNQSLTLSIDEPLANHTYKWYNETGPISGQTSTDYLVTATGNYYARVINPNTNCSDSSAQKQITVNAVPDKPSLEYNALNTIFCDGQSITLSTPAIADSYIWLKGTIETVGTNTLVASESGVYGLKVAKLYPNSLTCYSGMSEVVTVTKNPRPSKPNLVNSLGSVSNICSNQSLTLSIDEPLADHTYKWYNETGPISGQTSTDYLVTATGNYYARVTNPNTNCSDSSSQKQVTVNAVPTTPTIDYNINGTTFCEGNSLGLSTDAIADAYIWLRGSTEYPGTNTYLATESGVYGLKIAKSYPNDLTCYASSVNTVNVTKNSKPQKPVLVNSLGSVNSICNNQNLTLSIEEPLADHTYKWYNETGPISGQTSTDYLVTATGNYYARVTNPNTNCSDSSSQKQVTVNPTPQILEIVATDTVVCQGQPLLLSTREPIDGEVFQWYRGSTPIEQTNDSLYITQLGQFDYYVEATIGDCRTSSEPITTKVNGLPAIIKLGLSSPDQMICEGETFTITALENPTSYQYQWMRADSTFITEATSPQFKVKQTDGYMVQVTIPTTGCSLVSDTVLVVVNENPDKPQVGVSNNLMQFCEGLQTTLFTTLKDVTYQWKKTGDSQFTSQNDSVMVVQKGDYFVVVTNGFGCQAESDKLTIDVYPSPAKIDPTAESPAKFCEGGNVLLKAKYSSAQVQNYDFQWRTDKGIIAGETGLQYTANQSGNYWLEVTNKDNTCSVTTDPITVTVDAKPATPIIKEQNDKLVFCPKTPLKLLVTNSSLNYDYQWQHEGNNIEGADGPVLEGLLKGGLYSVFVTSGTCPAEQKNITLTEKPAPPKPEIQAVGNTVWILGCSNDSALAYRWSFNGQIIPNANKANYFANTNLGDYFVEINTGTDCWTASDVINIPSGTISGVTELVAEAISLYPNPSKGLVNLDLGGVIYGEINVVVMDALGKMYTEQKFEDVQRFELDLTGFKQGIYFVRIENQNNIVITKVMKE